MKNKEAGSLRLILTLTFVTILVSALLGLTNYFTADEIANNLRERTNSAMREVLFAERYEPLDYSDGIVRSVYRAYKDSTQIGWVVETLPTGFGGPIRMVTGIDMNGSISNISFIAMSETSGLGTRAKDSGFRDQFSALSDSAALTSEGGSIDAISGATVTSKAVINGVNAALDAINGGVDSE